MSKTSFAKPEVPHPAVQRRAEQHETWVKDTLAQLAAHYQERLDRCTPRGCTRKVTRFDAVEDLIHDLFNVEEATPQHVVSFLGGVAIYAASFLEHASEEANQPGDYNAQR